MSDAKCADCKKTMPDEVVRMMPHTWVNSTVLAHDASGLPWYLGTWHGLRLGWCRECIARYTTPQAS